jgi:hypothetical protein
VNLPVYYYYYNQIIHRGLITVPELAAIRSFHSLVVYRKPYLAAGGKTACSSSYAAQRPPNQPALACPRSSPGNNKENGRKRKKRGRREEKREGRREKETGQTGSTQASRLSSG